MMVCQSITVVIFIAVSHCPTKSLGLAVDIDAQRKLSEDGAWKQNYWIDWDNQPMSHGFYKCMMLILIALLSLIFMYISSLMHKTLIGGRDFKVDQLVAARGGRAMEDDIDIWDDDAHVVDLTFSHAAVDPDKGLAMKLKGQQEDEAELVDNKGADAKPKSSNKVRPKSNLRSPSKDRPKSSKSVSFDKAK